MDDAFEYFSFNPPLDENFLPIAESQETRQRPSADWKWGSAPMSPGTSQPPPFAFNPYSLPHTYDRTPLDAYPSSSSRSSYDVSAAVPKVAIPRATSISVHSQRRRSARACEPCRQRKIKCDGNKPACRQCLEQNVQCHYVDVKRVRDQKQLGVLTRKVHRFEKLLEEIEHESEGSVARRIRRTLRQASDQISSAEEDSYGSDDETSSMGSLEDIDLVEEDLNRDERSVATGFFGKNSEVSWLQRLEDESGRDNIMRTDDSPPGPARETPIAAVNFYLDDLNIPLLETVDPYALPKKEVADQYFNAYMESVHPSFMVLRRETFTAQYRQAWTRRPPRRWLAILNMVFAIGCRYCLFTSKGAGGDGDADDLIYLNRARKLSLSGNVLFEHADLQQVQVEFLAALYLFVTGQVNRAFKLSSLAFRSALALGINLRFVDHRVHHASKEARSRLWWSIYLLEHLLTAVTGRISCVGEGLSSTPLPIPFDEDQLDRPEVINLFQDPQLRLTRLKMTLLQTDEEARASADWLATCEPSSSLFFHCLVDLVTATQTIISNVYSIQGLREQPSRLEQRIRKYSHTLDIWRAKLPQCCRFTESPDTDRLRLHGNGSVPHLFREKVLLALNYYSSRIILCRPCLSTGAWRSRSHSPRSHSPRSSTSRPPNSRRSSVPGTSSGHRARMRAQMSVICLRAACTLIDIFPDTPDILWLTRYTPWWSVLHFLMQACTALLLGLFHSATNNQSTSVSAPPTPTHTAVKPPAAASLTLSIPRGSSNGGGGNAATVDDSISTTEMLEHVRKAFHWLHAMGRTDPASKRAFVLCDGFIRRIAAPAGLDISAFPDGTAMAGTSSAGEMSSLDESLNV
ncbi:C6 transcription factor [Aspergillus floccosus]